MPRGNLRGSLPVGVNRQLGAPNSLQIDLLGATMANLMGLSPRTVLYDCWVRWLLICVLPVALWRSKCSKWRIRQFKAESKLGSP